MAEQTNNQALTGIEKGVVERDSDEAQDRFVRGMAGGKAGGVDLANRTISGVASTINLDRDGEVILPSAFAARLAGFTGSHSPFCARHLSARWSDSKPAQIGWVMEVKIERQRVRCGFRFATTATAEEWWTLAADPNGKGIAFSIGFIPVRWVYGSVADLVREFPELKAPFKEAGLKDEDRVRVYTEIELLEISAVEVPSNRQALQLLAAKAYAAGEKADEVLAEFTQSVAAEVVRQMGATTLAPTAELTATGEPMGRQLTRIQDQLNEIMETIALSFDTLGQAPPPKADGPTAGEDASGDDAAQPGARVRQAAARLKTAAQH
ncbi:MAG TPA: hypothetical protein VMW52_07425 [Phycisphaerae bacterium]|nr:hypothetical protein [Phycisphaerae bacterium]